MVKSSHAECNYRLDPAGSDEVTIWVLSIDSHLPLRARTQARQSGQLPNTPTRRTRLYVSLEGIGTFSRAGRLCKSRGREESRFGLKVGICVAQTMPA